MSYKIQSICVFSFLFCFWITLERFFILLTHFSYSLVTCIKECCKCFSGKLFFTTLNRTLKFKKKINPRKMHFTAIYRLKFEKTSLRSPPWGQPKEPLNWVNSRKNEPLGEHGSRQRCLDKSLNITVKCQNIYNCSNCDFVWYEICQKRGIIFQINLLI